MKNIQKQIFVLLVAIGITMVMPFGGLRAVNVTLNQIWDKKALTAPFDIPILKTAAEIEQEQSSIASKNPTVFVMDTEANDKNKRGLNQEIQKMQLSVADRAKISRIVNKIYSEGVLSEDNHKTYASRTVYIKQTDDKQADALQSVYAGSLYTPKTAISELVKGTRLKADFLKPYIVPNLRYDSKLSKMLETSALQEISLTKGVIPRGETLIAEGQPIDQQTMLWIDSYNKALETNATNNWTVYLMYLLRFVIVLGVLALNLTFFTKFSAHYFVPTFKKLFFIMLLYVMMCALLGLVARFVQVSSYVVPVSIVAIYVLTFYNMRVAILCNLSMAMLGSMFVSNPFEYMFISIFSGMVAIFMMRHFYHRGKLIRALGAIVAVQVVLFLLFSVLFSADVGQVNYMPLLWMIVGGFMFLGFYQLIYLMEKMFGFVSDASLLELCDTNQPLLLKLAQTAPGTFQHSVQVSNLAESAAGAIGANPLLARVGGLYHDIGKIANPFYFVENTSGGFNPHNDCPPNRSADIIRGHVTDGLELARKYSLPMVVQEFIGSHHGDSRIMYFYDKAQKMWGSESVAAEDYSYPGPRPVSREVSICMMADAVEAASRSLGSYDRESLDKLVDSIVDRQIMDGQFHDSKLTFQQIGVVKQVLKRKLHGIYHGRIAYPKPSAE